MEYRKMDSTNKEVILDEEHVNGVKDFISAGDQELRINSLSVADRCAIERYSKGIFACPKYNDVFNLKDDTNLI